MGDVVAWWLAAEIIGIIGLPLAAVLFARLPERGWALARPLGLVVLGWLIWFPLSLMPALPYSRAWIAGTLIALALAGGALLRLRDVREALWRLLTRERGYLLAAEAVFTGSYALMAWLRSFTPGVVDTEKYMDVAFLSAIWRAPHLPAPDPWLAGQPINYYYFGHFLMATLAKLLGTQPAVAFNAAVALTFALTASAVFGVATNMVVWLRRERERALIRAAPYGVAAVLLVLILGNLEGAQVWWQGAVAATTRHDLATPWAWWTHPALWLQYDWWSPSRVFHASSATTLQGIITEFPSFSYILADLHAHVLALPFAAVAVGIAFNLLLSRGEGLRVFGDRAAGIVALGLAALTLGSLYAINGWDLPTYLGLSLLALAIQQWIEHGRRWSRLFLLDLASTAVLLGALCVLLYVPFYRGFTSPAQGIGSVPASARSLIGYDFAMFGLPIFLVGSLLCVRLGVWLRGIRAFNAGYPGGPAVTESVSLPTLALGTGLALLLIWTILSSSATGWTLMWCLLLLAGCAALALRHLVPSGEAADDVDESHRAEIMLWCLSGTALALIGVCELVYLRDVFGGGDLFRMNTVFKLYYQAWLLLGIAGGAALAGMVEVAGGALAHVAPAVPRMRPQSAAPVTSSFLAVRRMTGQPTSPHLALAAFSGGGDSPGGRVAGTSPGALPESGASVVAKAVTEAKHGTPLIMRMSVLRWLAAGGTLVWIALLLVLVGAAAVYPVQAAAARTINFTLPHSFDGIAYMRTDPQNQDDADAIAWLNDPAHVAGNPVIVEAVDARGGDYTHFARVSAFTGLPAVMGWVGHEWQWRVNWVNNPAHAGELQRRQTDVDQIYSTSNPNSLRDLLARYHVRYVYVGALERQRYGSVNLDRFATILRPVYHHGAVTIYQVT